MRRLSLSTKLFAAATPLLLTVAVLLAVTVRSSLSDVDRAEHGAALGRVWDPLITALSTLEAEIDETTTDGGAPAAPSATARRATDQAVNDLGAAVEELGAAQAANEHLTASRSSLSAARRNLDMAAVAPEMQGDIDPVLAYELAGREIVSIGQLLPSEAGDPELGRELLAVVKLAEAKLAADTITNELERWLADPADRAPLATARNAFTDLDATLGEFQAIAPEEWAAQYRQSGFTTALAGFRGQLDQALRAAQAGSTASFDLDGFERLVDQGVQFQSTISRSIVDRAGQQVDEARSSTLTRVGVTLAAVLLAALVAWFVIRSVTRRIQQVATSANQVANEQLPALVQAMNDPRGKSVLPDIEPVSTRGGDELSELATAFNSMQGTLVDVAHEQVEVLRRGVSDIFVTMARRNRSLIDRQLAMLDEFEAEVDDPDVLANYYQLDHLATRMRRNSESLLVLANAEPKRRRVKATEIDDVVRASIGEVEDYRRIDIEDLESLQVRGNVVADVSHLLAELLDNATSFSPPDSVVRVGGRRTGDSYMLRIVDSGVGIGPERIRELNELLRDPPIVGLSVEATLGISVVSLLANKHGIEVTLSAGSPGLTVDVVLPPALFGPIDVPAADTTPAAAPDEAIVAWGEAEPPASHDAAPPTGAPEQMPAPTGTDPRVADPAAAFPSAPEAPEDDAGVRVTTSDWAKMSDSLSAFRSGQRSAEATGGGPARRDDLAGPIDNPAARYDIDDGFVFEPPSASSRDVGDATDEDLLAVVDELAHRFDDPPVDGGADAGPDAGSHGTSTLPPVDEPSGRYDAPVAPLDAPAFPPAETDADLRSPTVAPDLPPPPSARRHGEFDLPPAPPMTAAGPSSRPVTPADAMPVPPDKGLTDTPPGSALPTRNPGRGPEGPDRLAEAPTASAGEPSALQAALSAFEAGTSNGAASGSTLPTPSRVGDPPPAAEEPVATSQSRLDPDALRERLRAFQNEYRTGIGDDAEVAQRHEPDLGGDRR